MPSTVLSADGTVIAYDVVGDGPAVALVAGMFCTRQTLAPLAAALADAGFRTATYDRRGRGDSGGAGPVPPPRAAVAREIEDLSAVSAALGDDVAFYGHSSGAALALRAAVGGLSARALILHEPPYDDEAGQAGRAQSAAIRTAVAEGRLADAITTFMAGMGLPDEALAGMAADPAMLAVAPTMPYDVAAVGDDGGVPEALARAVAVPTLVLAGTTSPPFFARTAARLAQLVPDAQLVLMEGADHGAGPAVVAPQVAAFLADA